MSIRQITAVVPVNEKKGITEQMSCTVNFDVPDTVAEYTQRYGEEVSKAILDQQLNVKVQAGIRGKLIKGRTAEEIQAWADSYVPGAPPSRKDPVEDLASKMAKLTPEQRDALKARLKEKLA